MGEVIRWLLRRTATHRVGVPILMYHRVCEARSDPWGICVSPQHFNEHMEHLCRHFTVLRIGDLIALLMAGRLPERAVAVTFDDGYADNLWNAKPILARWGVPATVFVASGYTLHSLEFWWDELHRIVLQPGRLPERLALSVEGRVTEWTLAGSVDYTEHDYLKYRSWRAEQNDSPTPRHALYRSVYALLHPLPWAAQRLALDQLSAQASNTSQDYQNDRPLSPDELISLTEGGLVEVGAHTVWHPVLSALPLAAQSDEINQGKVQLEEILGRRIAHFSYPHGRYTDETVALLKSATFTSACSSRKGLVRGDSDPFQLPRVVMGNWNGDEFARRMSESFSL